MATPLPPEVLPPDYEALGGIGGLLTPGEGYIPNIQSAYSSIIQNAPDYQYFTAPLSNKGNTTASYGTSNNLVVAPDTPIRVVDNATGKVVYSGTGYEGAQAAIDAATALSSSGGKKANWDIQVAAPGSKTFESVSTERPDVSALGIAADVALPIAASLLVPGGGFLGTILPAAGGSALSSVAQGRSLQDTLLRAALAGGGAGLGELAFTPAVDTLGRSIETMANNAIANLGTSVAGTTAGSAIGGATGAAAGSVPGSVGDIIVTALNQVPTAIGGATGSLFGSIPFSGSNPPYNPAEDINVTAKTETPLPTPVITPPTTPPSTPPVNPAEDITVTAKDVKTPPVAPPIVIPPGVFTPPSGPGTTTSTSSSTSDSSGAAKDTGVLGTGLNIAQLASIFGVGADLLGKLLGGDTSGADTTPYVSPFGTGTGAATFAPRTQVNPNIADYERYGFGPEAAFFSGVQSSPATYKPLI